MVYRTEALAPPKAVVCKDAEAPKGLRPSEQPEQLQQPGSNMWRVRGWGSGHPAGGDSDVWCVVAMKPGFHHSTGGRQAHGCGKEWAGFEGHLEQQRAQRSCQETGRVEGSR